MCMMAYGVGDVRKKKRKVKRKRQMWIIEMKENGEGGGRRWEEERWRGWTENEKTRKILLMRSTMYVYRKSGYHGRYKTQGEKERKKERKKIRSTKSTTYQVDRIRGRKLKELGEKAIKIIQNKMRKKRGGEGGREINQVTNREIVHSTSS